MPVEIDGLAVAVVLCLADGLHFQCLCWHKVLDMIFRVAQGRRKMLETVESFVYVCENRK